MYFSQISVEGIPNLKLPDVCTNSPLHNKAFCQDHCQLLNSRAPHIPTGLRDFLKHAGALKDGELYVTALCLGGNVHPMDLTVN